MKATQIDKNIFFKLNTLNDCDTTCATVWGWDLTDPLYEQSRKRKMEMTKMRMVW